MAERKILFSKQSKDVIDVFRNALDTTDYLLTMSTSASEMLAQVFMNMPDLIVLDGDPNATQSPEILRTVRANSETSNIPALIVLPDDNLELKRTFEEAGACDFAIKPLTSERIKTRVEALIKGRNLFGPRLNSKIITFFGAKGGTGTTTLATNFAIDLIEFEQTVLLLELANYFSGIKVSLNIRSRNSVPQLMNTKPEDLTSEKIFSFIHEHESGIKVLPTISGIADMEKMNTQTVEFMRYHLCPICDYTVFDAGHDLDEAVLELFDVSSMIIFVASLDITSLYNLELIAQIFEGTRLNLNKCFAVFNHTHHQGEIPESTLQDLKVKIPTLGFIPNHSAGFLKALNSSKPYMNMFPKSPAAKAIRALTDRILEAMGTKETKVTAA